MRIIGVRQWAIACGAASVFLCGIVMPIAFAPAQEEQPGTCLNYVAQDYGMASVTCPHESHQMKVTSRGDYNETSAFLVECVCPQK